MSRSKMLTPKTRATESSSDSFHSEARRNQLLVVVTLTLGFAMMSHTSVSVDAWGPTVAVTPLKHPNDTERELLLGNLVSTKRIAGDEVTLHCGKKLKVSAYWFNNGKIGGIQVPHRS